MMFFAIYMLVAAAVWMPFYRLARRNSPLLSGGDAVIYAAAGALAWPISLVFFAFERLIREEI